MCPSCAALCAFVNPKVVVVLVFYVLENNSDRRNFRWYANNNNNLHKFNGWVKNTINRIVHTEVEVCVRVFFRFCLLVNRIGSTYVSFIDSCRHLDSYNRYNIKCIQVRYSNQSILMEQMCLNQCSLKIFQGPTRQKVLDIVTIISHVCECTHHITSRCTVLRRCHRSKTTFDRYSSITIINL